MKDAIKEEDTKRQGFDNARQKVDEARVMMQSAQSRGAVLTALLKEQAAKRLSGICVRAPNYRDCVVTTRQFVASLPTTCS